MGGQGQAVAPGGGKEAQTKQQRARVMPQVQRIMYDKAEREGPMRTLELRAEDQRGELELLAAKSQKQKDQNPTQDTQGDGSERQRQPEQPDKETLSEQEFAQHLRETATSEEDRKYADIFSKYKFDPNGPSELEIIKKYPNATVTAGVLFLFAQEKREENFGDDPKGNVFQHAYVSYVLTRMHGEDVAKAFGDAHEANPNTGEKNDHRNMLQDIHANAFGRKVAGEQMNRKNDITKLPNKYDFGKNGIVKKDDIFTIIREADEVLAEAMKTGQLFPNLPEDAK